MAYFRSEVRKLELISPIDVLQILTFGLGASGVVQGLPPMSPFDYARMALGFFVIGFDIYVFILRRSRSKKR
jgi:hypothetical protein